MKRPLFVHTVIAVAMLIAGGCASRNEITVGVGIPEQYIFSDAAQSAATDSRWWEIFGDSTLNALIETALTNNRDIAIAASRVEQARYNLDIARSEYLPSFSAAVSAQGDYALSTTTGEKVIGQTYSVLPAVSWDISLFGALKNSSAAARAEILSTEAAHRGVMLSLAAQVATTYFQWLRYAVSLQISERSYALRTEAQQRIDSMYHYGFSSAVDLEQARSLTATAEADIPAYRRALLQTNLALNVLLGQPPEIMVLPDVSITFSSEDINGFMNNMLSPNKLPSEIPAGLPSDLLNNRPDVIEAYGAMESAAAKARVARAERFPSIQLTASGGILAYSVKALTEHNPFYWSAAAGITEPIFSFGRLKRNEQSAIENYRQSVLNYEQTMLTALSDVESALVAIDTYRNQVPLYTALIEANRKLQVMTSALYMDGLASYLNAIDAERNLYSSQLQYVQILTEQLDSYVNLYQALGGGW